MKKFILPLSLLSLFAFNAQAQVIPTKTITTEFNVNMNILAACTVETPEAANFGDVLPTSTSNSAETEVTVQCSKGTPYVLAMAPSSGEMDGIGYLSSVGGGTDKVSYSIFQDSARTKPWGASPELTVEGLGNGKAEVHTVYLHNTEANFEPGAYSDLVDVFVGY